MSATASRQHGVVARWQMLAAGISRQQVERRIGRQLHSLWPGVYAVGHTSVSREARWIAAALLGGPGSAVSHRTGAVLWRMLDEPGTKIHVTVPRAGGRGEHAGIVLHRALPFERAVVDGIPVTTPARTLVDLAATAPLRTVEAAVRGAVRHDVFDLAAVREAARGRKGAARLRTAIAAWDDVPTRSELEVAFLALCKRHGIVAPSVNVPFLEYTLDFVWWDHRVVVETDGMAWHGTRAAAIADRERDAALTRAGLRCQRFTWQQVQQSERETAATLAALGLRKSR